LAAIIFVVTVRFGNNSPCLKSRNLLTLILRYYDIGGNQQPDSEKGTITKEVAVDGIAELKETAAESAKGTANSRPMPSRIRKKIRFVSTAAGA